MSVDIILDLHVNPENREELLSFFLQYSPIRVLTRGAKILQ